jgi:hypothetical protein
MVIAIISSPVTFVTGQFEKDSDSIFMYPVFDVQNDWMIEKVTGTSVIIRDLSDITDLEASENTYELLLPLEGTDILSLWWTDFSLAIPTVDDRTFDDLLLEMLERTPVHSPEWQGYCILDETKPHHTSSDDFFKQQKFHLEGNYAFMEILEDSNDHAIEIIDITDIAAPVTEARYKYENTVIFDYEVYEDIMIVSIDEEENIKLVDISDKSNPVTLNQTFIVPYQDYCYLLVKNNQLFVFSEGTITVFDMSNIPELEVVYEFDLGLAESNQIQKIAFYEHYLIAISKTVISIFDTDPIPYSLVSEITFDGPGFEGFYYGLIDNEYLYVALYNKIEDYTLAVYDLTNILEPVLVFPTEFTTSLPVSIITSITILIQIAFIITIHRKRKKKLSSGSN